MSNEDTSLMVVFFFPWYEAFPSRVSHSQSFNGLYSPPNLPLKTHLQRKSPHILLTLFSLYRTMYHGHVSWVCRQVDYVKGFGKLGGPNTVNVDLTDGGVQTLESKNILIATGSEVSPLPPVPVDNAQGKIVDSTGALELKEVD